MLCCSLAVMAEEVAGSPTNLKDLTNSEVFQFRWTETLSLVVLYGGDKFQKIDSFGGLSRRTYNTVKKSTSAKEFYGHYRRFDFGSVDIRKFCRMSSGSLMLCIILV